MTSDKRKKIGACYICGIVLSAAVIVQDVWAQQDEGAGVVARYPSGSIQSSEAADQALAAVAKERADVEQRFVTEKNACLSRFFASSCEEDAKERRRAALERLRAVEVEANAYQRRERVVERDRALEEKRVQDEKERQERVRQQQVSPQQSRAQGKPQQSAAEAAQAEAMASERQARHQEKLRRIEAEEAANAQKRADNVTAYQKKVQAAQDRQKEVERKKAEKARERAQQPTAPAAQ